MEVVIGICLTIMGIYFFKSTDLPKELIERRTQMRNETGPLVVSTTKKMSIINGINSDKSATINQAKLVELSLNKKSSELKLHHEAIDKLTLTITTLEQEIKLNNKRNKEIQAIIDSHLVSLQLLQDKVNSLS